MAGTPEDLGLIVLTEAARETPLVMDEGSLSDLFGQPLTSIGFGETLDGTMGIKRTVTTRVDSMRNNLFWTPPSVCPGDSGGAGIGPNGHVYGVAVEFENPPSVPGMAICGVGLGAYNPIDIHMDWIQSIIQSTGDACFAHAETCDGVDDDCDDLVDEGCLADGAACDDASTCASTRCETVGAGRICTRGCDPTRGDSTCRGELRCVRISSCDGLCGPVAGPLLGIGAACTTDAECVRGSCVDPGDGTTRCLAVCHGDLGDCAAEEVCTATDGACGTCVRQERFGSAHGLGEECTTDEQCRSGHCVAQDGIRVCASPCESEACAAGSVCQNGFCAMTRTQPAGGVCVARSDCATGQCLAQGSRAWCTDDCAVSACPTGFDCQDIGDARACVPVSALAGEPCRATSECARGACVGGVCAEACDRSADCGRGLRCLRDGDGAAAHCQPPGAAASSGCAVARAGRSPVPRRLPLLGLLVALASLRRRRPTPIRTAGPTP